MSGIDFDRQAFVAPTEQPAPQQPRALGLIILAIAVIGIAFIGYKLLSYAGEGSASAESNSLQQIQQQLADMKERMDQMEKRHKPGAQESTLPPSRTEASVPLAASRTKPAYQISAASALNPQRVPPSPAVQPAAPRTVPASTESDNTNREAWKATSDRLSDVVGVVGSQQGEIAQTRDELNQLLAQTRRTALQFELSRGPDHEAVGPVELQLKNTDAKAQRYTVCVYVDSKCIELKNRVLDEVVVFVLARGTAPLELVATRISRDEIAGYLEVPSEKVGR